MVFHVNSFVIANEVKPEGFAEGNQSSVLHIDCFVATLLVMTALFFVIANEVKQSRIALCGLLRRSSSQ